MKLPSPNRRLPATHLFVSVAVLLFMLPALSTAEYSDAVKNCMLQKMEASGDNVTIGRIKEYCLEEQVEESVSDVNKVTEGLVQGRLAADDENVQKAFTLMAYRPNYLLVGAYNSSGYGTEDFSQGLGEEIDFKDTEAQFQVSIKFPLAVNLFDKNIDIYAAYTNRSFWQVYASDLSAPFRDTNHEPEAWVQFRPNWEFAGFRNSVNQIGINHQSNGRGGTLTHDTHSRSWNRIYANFILERDNLALGIKPWYRIPEDDEDDDNPDITDYLGYGEVRGAYRWNDHTFGMMFRNVFESNFEKGTVELSWSFPIPGYNHFRGYMQVFNGYGQSLADYDKHVNSIGIGLSLTDYL